MPHENPGVNPVSQPGFKGFRGDSANEIRRMEQQAGAPFGSNEFAAFHGFPPPHPTQTPGVLGSPLPANTGTSNIDNQIITDWKAGKFANTEAVIAAIMSGLGLSRVDAVEHYKTLQPRLPGSTVIQPVPGGGGGGGQGQVGGQPKTVKDILDALAAGAISPADAQELMQTLVADLARGGLDGAGGGQFDTAIPSVTRRPDEFTQANPLLTQGEQVTQFLNERFGIDQISNPALRRGAAAQTSFLPQIFDLLQPEGGTTTFPQFLRGQNFSGGQGSQQFGGQISSALNSFLGSDLGDPSNFLGQFLQNENANTIAGRFDPAVTASLLPRYLQLAPRFREAALSQGRQFAESEFLRDPGGFQNPQDVLSLFKQRGFF